MLYLFFVRIYVRIGEYNILSDKDQLIKFYGTDKYNPPVQDLKVEDIIPYPDYNPINLLNDIGLIRVAKMNLSIGNNKQ